MSKWISIKNRLPENGTYVITYIPCSVKYIRSNWYITDEERWHEGDDGITHWMELPDVPDYQQ